MTTVGDRYLKKPGVDAHSVKREVLGPNAPLSRFDIMYDTKTELYYLLRKNEQDALPEELGALDDLLELSE